MKKNNVIRTYPIKGLVIFLIGVVICSALIAVGNYFLLQDNLALQITVYIFCGIFFILSLIVLLKEALIYLYYEDETKSLVINNFIFKKKIPLTELSRIESKDGFYIFYKGKKELYRIGVERNGVGALMIALEKNGATIKW